MIFLKSLKDLFKQSVPHMIVKYSGEAQASETVESKRAGDRYVAARMKTDGFNNYREFTYTSLIKAGFTDAEARLYSSDKFKIPFNRRDIAVRAQREEIIANYEEKNNYYRTLNGLPMNEDLEQIWLDKRVYDENNIEPCAVHKIDHDILVSLETLGELDEIRNRYPDKEYLNFLGRKRVDIVTARLADNFEIIYFPRIQGQDNYYNNFIMTYEECREFFLTVIYNRYYGNRHDYYDNFIAFNILIMALNRLIPNMLLRFKEREFYDVDTMRIFLESYGIKYESAFNSQQLRMLCKNLNILLQGKSTNSVFVDVIDLLGYANCNVMKYYLVKQHKMGEDGKPIFPYKTELDEEGNEIQVLDKDSMYDFYFVSTDIDNFNISESLHDEHKRVSYAQMTMGDDYWVEDERLRKKLIESEFNYIETKYLDIDIMFRLQEVLFETCYLTRLVLDNHYTRSAMISMNKVSVNDISAFDAFILLICLMCKYNHTEPDLLSTPSKVLYITGFNFEADIQAIRNDIEKSPILDKKLLTYITDDILTSVESINSKYTKIKELEQLLTRRMNECETIEAYNAYDKLYKTLLYTKLNNNIYKLNDGSVPLQFTDYLKDKNIVLYEYLETLKDDESVVHSIDYVTSILSKYFESTEYLNNIKFMDISQIEAITRLLRFFKSYTVHMKETNMIILLDSRYYNTMFWLSKVNFGGEDGMQIVMPDKSLLDCMKDGIAREKGIEKVGDKPVLDNKEMFLSDMIYEERPYIDFRLFYDLDMKVNDEFTMKECLKFIVMSDIILKSKVNFRDVTNTLSKSVYKDRPNIDFKQFYETFMKSNNNITVFEYYRPDIVNILIKSLDILIDANVLYVDMIHQERPNLELKPIFDSYVTHREDCSLTDSINFALINEFMIKTNGGLIDKSKDIAKIYSDTVLSTFHKIMDTAIRMISKDNVSLSDVISCNYTISSNERMGFRDTAVIIRPD